MAYNWNIFNGDNLYHSSLDIVALWFSSHKNGRMKYEMMTCKMSWHAKSSVFAEVNGKNDVNSSVILGNSERILNVSSSPVVCHTNRYKLME